MALETKRAAVNTAMDSVIAAIKDLTDGLSAGEEIYICLPQIHEPTASAGGGPVAPTNPTFSTTPALQNIVKVQIRTGSSANSYIWAIPGQELGFFPLVWKMTNAAGETS